MARIVAGLFEDQQGADGAIAQLREGGAPQDAITSFVLNPPGMHGGRSAGGDPQAQGGEDGALRGAALGGAAGALAGLVVAPVVGPLGVAAGIGAGAYVGSLAGAASAMGDEEARKPTARPGGIVVAVNTESVPEPRAVNMLRDAGANMIEVEEGDWADGHWRDFPVLEPPRSVVFVRGNPNYPT